MAKKDTSNSHRIFISATTGSVIELRFESGGCARILLDSWDLRRILENILERESGRKTPDQGFLKALNGVIEKLSTTRHSSYSVRFDGIMGATGVRLEPIFESTGDARAKQKAWVKSMLPPDWEDIDRWREEAEQERALLDSE